MTNALIPPILLGADGFAACLAIGLLGLASPRRWAFAGWFGLCDGLALLAGHALRVTPDWSAAAVALWTTLALLLVVSRAQPILPLLPVLLALDNLLAGAADAGTTLPGEALLSCIVSAGLAGAGLLAGAKIAGRPPASFQARLAGAALLLSVGVVSIAA